MIDLRDLVGKPYKDHARGPDFYDCYGVAIEVYRRYGKVLKDLYREFLEKDEHDLVAGVIEIMGAYKVEQPVPLAIVLLRVPVGCHIGVCLGHGEFIHAMRDTGVQIENLSAWRKRTEGFYLWP